MPDELSCKEKILSNDYKDFLVSVGEHTLLGLGQEVRGCVQYVMGNYRVLYVKGVESPPSMAELGYETIPKLYTLTDSTNMDAAGITKLQNQPYLRLDGRGVLIGLADTGERVIIMSS